MAAPGRQDSILSVAPLRFQTWGQFAQPVKDVNEPGIDHNPNRRRIRVVTGIHAVVMMGVYAAHIKPWWSGQKSGFRLKYDFYNNYWLEMDKWGHFYANIQTARLSAALFEHAEVERRRALWIGFANREGGLSSLPQRWNEDNSSRPFGSSFSPLND